MNWIAKYNAALFMHFELVYYDVQKLGGIDTTNPTEEELHQQFVYGGIDRAVKNLIALEKENIKILAFSIGGTIAWKAINKGLKCSALYAISATRLRKEIHPPKQTKLHLYYGELDVYKPSKVWCENLKIEKPKVLEKHSHTMYKEDVFIKEMCFKIISNEGKRSN